MDKAVANRLLTLVLAISMTAGAAIAQENGAHDKEASLAKSDSLFALGVDLYNAARYEDAIPVFTECDLIDKAALDSTSNRRGYSAMWLASCHYRLGDARRAKELDEMFYMLDPIDRRLTVESDSLADLSQKLIDDERLDEAIPYLARCAEIEKSALGDKSYYYATSLSEIGFYHMCLGNLEEACAYLEESAAIIEGLCGMTHAMYLLDAHYAVVAYFNLKKYSDAIRCGRNLPSLMAREYGQDAPGYHEVLYDLACCYGAVLKPDEMRQLCEELLEHITPEHEYYLPTLYMLSASYALDDPKEGLRILRQILELVDESDPDYEAYMLSLSQFKALAGEGDDDSAWTADARERYARGEDRNTIGYVVWQEQNIQKAINEGRYAEALSSAEELEIICETLTGRESTHYILALYNQSLCRWAIKGSKDTLARYCASRALQAYQASGLDNDMLYAKLLWAMTEYCAAETLFLGDDDLRWVAEAEQLYKKIYGTESVEYATVLNRLAMCLKNTKHHQEAVKAGEETLAVFERVYGKESENYAVALNNLAVYYNQAGMTDQAARISKKSASLHNKTTGKETKGYILTLKNQAEIQKDNGNIKSAISLLEKALPLCEEVYGSDQKEYADILVILASYYAEREDYSQAARLCRQAVDTYSLLYEPDTPDWTGYYIGSLESLARYTIKLEDYQEALGMLETVLPVWERLFGRETKHCALTLRSMAECHNMLAQTREAIELQAEVTRIYSKLDGEDSENHLASLHSLAEYYDDDGNYPQAIAAGEKLAEICLGLYGEDDNYGEALHNLSKYYNNNYNHSKAIALEEQVVAIRAKAYGTDDPEYAASLQSLARYHDDIGNPAKALELEEKAKEIYQKTPGKSSSTYAVALNNLALYYSHRDDYDKAVKLQKEALSITGKLYGENAPLYATCLGNLASYYDDACDYDQAISLGYQALEIVESNFGRRHQECALKLSNLSVYTSNAGRFSEAVKLAEEALDIYQEIYGEESPDCALAMSNLSSYYRSLGNLPAAMRWASRAIEVRKARLGKTHPGYVQSLGDIAAIAFSQEDYEKSARLTEEAVEINETLYGRKSSKVAFGLHNLATIYLRLDRVDDALASAKEALEIMKDLYGKDSPSLMAYLGILADVYSLGLGDNEQALECLKEQRRLCMKYLGPDHPNLIDLNFRLTNALMATGQHDKAGQTATETTELTARVVKETFANLTANERSMFWSTVDNWFNYYVHLYTNLSPAGAMVSNAYNCALLSKGLLLNSEIEFSNLIQESGDSAALALYGDLRALRLQINRLREKPIAERSVNVDSLDRIAQDREKALIERSKVFGDYTKNLVITWDQVQEKLTDKDIAVEFVSFPLNADNTMYMAYALRKGWECPRMIKLFEEKELQAARASGDIYRGDAVSRLVWMPLDEVMQGVENVFFAPSGELYNIAIESVPSHEDGGQTLVGERRDYYRLSSTRELALTKDENKWKEAAVYGGLQYGMSVAQMIEQDGKYEKRDAATRSDSSPSYYVSRDDRDDRDVSVSNEIKPLDYLEGTREEAIAICDDLKRQSVSARLLTDSAGTETSFKDLHGRKKSIIHIGTHGFFNDRRRVYEESGPQPQGLDQQAKVVEDDALTQSGLYFAGADNARINGRAAIPDSVDDGKLTALEIAQLDLRGLDLVVLSACQTGLGEITGDGVFGLQRGFKKAGAQTIVMSLWSVNDKATKDFMTKFFESVETDAHGHPLNKQQAFRIAQQYLRDNKEKYPEDPNCWAAFVMLDGVR